MSDPGYEYLIERDPEFAADDGYDKSYWVYDNEIRRGRYNEGTYWPTPENERTPIFTIELSRIDDDEAYVETPMKYSKVYYSDDEAFEDAEKLAAEYANEDGKFEVHIMAGEYQIGDGVDIYGDPYVQDSIQTGRGWKMVKEGFMSNIGKDGQRLYSIIYRADGWDGSVQEYGKSEEDAIQAAIAKGKLDGDEDIVKVVDLGEKGEYLESSRKLVKEGAGAGYDVGISDLEIDKVTEVKPLDDGDYSFTATIKPGNYEISAESYYDDFFWDLHESGINPEAKIDGGVIHGTICPWEDTDDPEEWVRYHVKGHTFNLSFMYGGGWSHVNLPEDGQLYIDEHLKITPELYFSVDDIQLDAIDLAQAVNDGYASLDDRYNDEGESEEYGESTKKTVKESSEDFERFFKTLKFKFRKDGCNVNLRDNEDGTESIEIDAPNDSDGKLFDFIKRKCESNNWFFERDRGGLMVTYSISENEEPVNESSDDNDLTWHEVTDAFEEFEQRLWSFTKQDMKGRRDAFSRCTNAMEKALREYYNEVVL